MSTYDITIITLYAWENQDAMMHVDISGAHI
jgi:hypothetical protein